MADTYSMGLHADKVGTRWLKTLSATQIHQAFAIAASLVESGRALQQGNVDQDLRYILRNYARRTNIPTGDRVSEITGALFDGARVLDVEHANVALVAGFCATGVFTTNLTVSDMQKAMQPIHGAPVLGGEAEAQVARDEAMFMQQIVLFPKHRCTICHNFREMTVPSSLGVVCFPCMRVGLYTTGNKFPLV